MRRFQLKGVRFLLSSPIEKNMNLPGFICVAFVIFTLPLRAGEIIEGAGQYQDGHLLQVGRPFASWQPGFLDIHHIATGRGNASFVQMPDGTTLVVDVGASMTHDEEIAVPRPNKQLRPGQWVSRYIKRHSSKGENAKVDYLLVTHIHPDHMGDVNANSPWSTFGKYRLGGVTDLAEEISIGCVLDRGFKDYLNIKPLYQVPFTENYLAYLTDRVSKGLCVESVVVGSNSQIKPLGGNSNAHFEIRNVASSGFVWTGVAEEKRNHVPLGLAPTDAPNENMASVAIKLNYGNFSYLTAGDLTSYTFDGDQPWQDIFTAVSKVVGRVDVASAPHHGMFDGLSAESVRHLKPRVWVIQSWHLSHPDMLQLERMQSQRLYKGPRDILATNIMRETYLTQKRLMKNLKSTEGHVVIRVYPGGREYQVFVTECNDESDTILWMSERYAAGTTLH
jgi:beta-lactamase superfamily II metal-dependent hydrolase